MSGERRTWKYLGEKIGIPLGIWILTTLITQILRKYGGISPMIESIFQNFVVELWPIWIGAICVILYLIIRFSTDVYKAYANYETFKKEKSKDKEIIDAIALKVESIDKTFNKFDSEAVIGDLRKLKEFKDWTYWHSKDYETQEFSSLEEKINYLIDEKVQPLRINSPRDEISVPRELSVIGEFLHRNATVWVIIHPKDNPDYYVHQPGIKVQRDGIWSGKVYVGRLGSPVPSFLPPGLPGGSLVGPSPDVGKRFEIMAVVDPKSKLEEIKRLSQWPEAQYKSQIITVIRE